MLVVKDRQCLGLVLLGFLVAQIGDGFGGDQCGSRRGHGDVMGHGDVLRGGDGGGFGWVLLCFWVFVVTLVFFFFNMGFCFGRILVRSG